ALPILKEAIKVISKASSKGIIHRNTASRKISRLMKKVTAAFRSEAA
ncbi:MAG TPA: 30S ribosomal protein S20, partial [Nitrospirae bacterium]|nr:30S ribosomal protein S20 [Nitrospirota bacterium]